MCCWQKQNHTEPEQPWCLSFNFRAFITLFSVFLPTSCHALIMPVTSCKCSLLLIFHSWQRSVCSSTELVFACVAPDVNALTNFHPGREALYVFKDVYIILSVLQWKHEWTPEGWALLSCRRSSVFFTHEWCSALFNHSLPCLSFRPINSEPRPCTIHSTQSGMRPWPTTASLMRIWSAKHSGTVSATHVCPLNEWKEKKGMKDVEKRRKEWLDIWIQMKK